MIASSNNRDSFVGNDRIQLLDHNPNGTFTGDLAQDTLHLYTHYFETDPASQNLVPNSTIEVANSGEINPGRVGMGLSSTLLQDLVTQGLIAARTYSLYIGQGFDRAAGMVNGSNTYGGYDSGRFTGAVHTYPMTTGNPNPMSVRVKDIYITNTNDPSSNVSLFDTAKFPSTPAPQAFEAQITTDQYPLSLPYAITQNFIAQLDATTDNTYGDNSLKLKSAFNGSLSIVLDDGFTVTLPPEILSNVSNITPIQSRSKDDTSPFYLSTAFLTQVYLMIDFEDYVFHLATAVQKNAPVMPVTFCPKSTPAPYVPPKQSAFVAQGLIGAVIGGVLGGIGLAITGWCFFLGVMRKRQERRWERRRELEGGMGGRKGMSVEVEDVPEFDPPPKSATPFFWKKMGR
jgi:hypothetical protein